MKTPANPPVSNSDAGISPISSRRFACALIGVSLAQLERP